VKITLTNVRGFEGTHTIEIRPVTILIGENSSGKTTLLAAIAAVLNRDFPAADNLFNRAPFELGSFDTIATYRGGSYGRASSFSIGWQGSGADSENSISATFKNSSGIPRVDSVLVTDGPNSLTVKTTTDNLEFQLVFAPRDRSGPSAKRNTTTQTLKFKSKADARRTFRFEDCVRYYFESRNNKSELSPDRRLDDQEAFQALHELSVRRGRPLPHATALAPLRTRPKRTYDEVGEDFKPEGDHVPQVLARLLASKETNAKQISALMSYGKASGLFHKIDVKRLGKRPSDPFQVRVKMQGPDANLVDVGYGVSQSLPIVIDSIIAPMNEVLLVQQPEVHLHPKAQAALGTFFVELVTSSRKQFVIETHSDHLVDRVRLAIAEKKIPAGKVQLLYLERKGLDITIHELKLDELGNVTNAPVAYRDFFLQEEIKLMSRAS
jgi:energy-coupling factor transporter ATP-binding protein EcfA2